MQNIRKGGANSNAISSTTYLSSSTTALEDLTLEAAEATKRDLEDGDAGPLRKRDRK
jgi:hypothetical protein